MRLLLDINIILDVVFQRPGEPASSALIASCGTQNQAWLGWHSVATLAYLIERERNANDYSGQNQAAHKCIHPPLVSFNIPSDDNNEAYLDKL